MDRTINIVVNTKTHSYKVEAIGGEYNMSFSITQTGSIDPIAEGQIEYTGCININYENCVHFCSEQELLGFGEVMSKLFDLAKKEIKNYQE